MTTGSEPEVITGSDQNFEPEVTTGNGPEVTRSIPEVTRYEPEVTSIFNRKWLPDTEGILVETSTACYYNKICLCKVSLCI